MVARLFGRSAATRNTDPAAPRSPLAGAPAPAGRPPPSQDLRPRLACDRTTLASMHPEDVLDNAAGALGIAATVALSPLLRPLYARWGATDDEVAEALPGDAIVEHPTLQSTRAIDIAATPADVYPWLVQLGYGRGGLYSYEGLENLVGCGIVNADAILPEHQHLAPGDLVRMGPPGFPCFRVVELVPSGHLILQACDPKTEEPGAMSWQFLVRPTAGGCRLIVRGRMHFTDSAADVLTWRVFTDPIWFVMERRMMIGIRDRAERRSERVGLAAHDLVPLA